MAVPKFDDLFAPLLGLPCWGVTQGYASFLTMEFGQPRQEVHGIFEPTTGAQRYPHRVVAIRGDWHLWIYCCAWNMGHSGETLASWESSADLIATACRHLDGQMLTGFSAEPAGGTARFRFDLGGTLETWPFDEEMNEQWMLYCPDGNVFTYRSDGRVKFTPGSGVNSGDETWPAAR